MYWGCSVNTPDRPFPDFVSPHKTRDRLVIPEVLVHPGNQAAIGSSVFMASLPDVDILEEFNIAIAILFYCGLDTYLTIENSNIPVEFLRLRDMLRGKYNAKVHTGAGRKFWEVTGLQPTASVVDCLRKLIELLQQSEGCPEICSEASITNTADWVLSTNCRTNMDSYELHCFTAKRQLFLTVGNTFYCIRSGVRINIMKRIFNDWTYDLDVGMLKRTGSHSSNNKTASPHNNIPVQQTIKTRFKEDDTLNKKITPGFHHPAEPRNSPIYEPTAKKRKGNDIKLRTSESESDQEYFKRVTKVVHHPVAKLHSIPNHDRQPQPTSKTLKADGIKIIPSPDSNQDNLTQPHSNSVTMPFVKEPKPEVIDLGLSPVTIPINTREDDPEQTRILYPATNASNASFNDLLDDEKQPIRQIYPDKSTLVCCSTTTVFGINVGEWM